MASYAQSSFLGGMNMAVDDSRLGEDEYRLAFNVRNRYGDLRPIRCPDSINIGFTKDVRLQGLYTVGDFLFAFQNGEAKFKHRLADTGSLIVDNTWTTLWDTSNSNLMLDANVDTVYIQAVPGSVMDMPRKATSSSVANDENNPSVKLTYNTTKWTKTIAGIIVQDGVNQPNLIVFSSTDAGATATIRKCRTFAEWGTGASGEEIREYVPIGKQMLFFGGKLYIVSPDGKQIYHSVSGRPLDFVVPIDQNGVKIAASEADGGAPAVSYSVSYEPITCIHALNTDSFFVSTRTASYAVTPNLNHTLFGEPTFGKTYLFSASVVNQHSFVDAGGDFVFIDTEGLRSFNAVKQLKNEGRNSAFSLKVAKLFEGVVQDVTAAIEFDNYVLFACKTIYGYGVVVYDNTSQKFVSLDLLAENKHTGYALGSSVPAITQFTKIDSDTAHELYASTIDGRLLKLYSGNNWSTAFIQTRAYSTHDPRVEQKVTQMRSLFIANEPLEVDWLRFYTATLDTPPVSFGWISPAGVNVNHTSPGTLVTGDPFSMPVVKGPYSSAILPHDLPVGTKFRISNVPTTTMGGTGIFTLTAPAVFNTSDAVLTLTGTFTSASEQTSRHISGVDTKILLIRDGQGIVKSSVLVNGRKSDTPDTIKKTIVAPAADALRYDSKYPIMWGNENKIQNILFNFQQGRSGWKVSHTLTWDTGASLSMLNIETQDMTPKNPLMTQAYGS